MQSRQPYTKGPFRLDETNGVLHYRGAPVVGVADLHQHGSPSRFYYPDAPGEMREGLIAAGVANPYSLWVYRCVVCDAWFTGGGFNTCSDECRKPYRAAQVRERRAKARGAVEKCAHCGGPLAGQRTSRRYCSNRCRQAAHRKQHGG